MPAKNITLGSKVRVKSHDATLAAYGPNDTQDHGWYASRNLAPIDSYQFVQAMPYPDMIVVSSGPAVKSPTKAMHIDDLELEVHDVWNRILDGRESPRYY